jgi:hypothetical protein
MERDATRIDYRALLTAYQQAVDAYRAHPSPALGQRIEDGASLLSIALLLPGRFELGQLVATPGALTALGEAGHIPPEFLLRHKHGDWGDLDPDDVAENERAVREGSRVFSAYRTRLDEKFWVITEWDRSVTTLLLPEDY